MDAFRIPSVDLNDYVPSRSDLGKLTRAQCELYGVVPISVAGSSLIVAMTNPETKRLVILTLAALTSMKIEPVRATERDIYAAIHRWYATSN